MPTDTPQPESALDANRRHNRLMEAMHDFKSAVLEYYSHEVVAAQAALQQAGIISPSIVTGINDLAGLYATATDALIEAMEEELAGEPEGRRATPHYAGMRFMLDFAKKWTGHDK